MRDRKNTLYELNGTPVKTLQRFVEKCEKDRLDGCKVVSRDDINASSTRGKVENRDNPDADIEIRKLDVDMIFRNDEIPTLYDGTPSI